MLTIFIISQLFVCFAYYFTIKSFLEKKQYKSLTKMSIALFCFLIQYLLLGGISAVISCSINIIRNGVLKYNIRKKKTQNKLVLIVFTIIIFVLTYIAYEKPIDILPGIVSEICLIGYWINTRKMFLFGNVIGSLCIIIYVFPLHSYLVLIGETISVVVSSIQVIKIIFNEYNYNSNLKLNNIKHILK